MSTKSFSIQRTTQSGVEFLTKRTHGQAIAKMP